MKINLIICSYAGRYYKFDSIPNIIKKNRENYLKYNLLLLNNIEQNLEQITIMKPKINKEHTVIENYYNFENLFIENIKHKIKIIDCENIGISYGQFFTGIVNNLDFDYHIFIEDDYIPFQNNFDMLLVNEMKTRDDESFICSTIFNNICYKSNEIFILNNLFKKYNYNTNYNLNIPDFSLGILSKKTVNKLLIFYNNYNNIIDFFKVNVSKNWVYQIIFGYIFDIANIKMLDFNDKYLNIFFESENNSLYLTNFNQNFKEWKKISLNKKYKLPLFIPLDMFYPYDYKSDIMEMKRFLCDEYITMFTDTFNKLEQIKKNHNKSIYIYMNKNRLDYLPCYLYIMSLIKIFTKHVSTNIKITSYPQIIKNEKPDILFLFSFSIGEVINCFHPNQLKFIISTEHYEIHNIKQNLEILNTRKNVTFIEYNSINVKYIKNSCENINIQYAPLLYHPFLISYYTNIIQNIINYDNKLIDILFYGNLTPRRASILNILKEKFHVKIIDCCSNQELCKIINNSKIVLNIFGNDINKPFDYYRNTFLLANKVILISEYPESIDIIIEPLLTNIEKYLLVPKYNDIVKCVDNILSNYTQNNIDDILNKQTLFIENMSMESKYVDMINKNVFTI